MDDWQTVHTYANDSDINKHLSFGAISSVDGCKHYIQNAIEAAESSKRHTYKLGMMLKPSSDLLGSCWLDILDPESRVASIGYFVDRHLWGRGYAVQMVLALLKFGFVEEGLHRIWASCDAENAASRKVLEKAGLFQEGLLRQNCLRSYGWSDTCIYAILADDWRRSTK